MFRNPVMVLGDVMLDRHVHGHVRRISPEAPVPVVSLAGEVHTPGGAGNVAATLAGLGCPVTLAGLMGAEPEGDQLCEALHSKGVARLALIEQAGLKTISKTRILSDTHQQLLRLDRDGDRDSFMALEGTARAGSPPDRRPSRGRPGRLRERSDHPPGVSHRHPTAAASGAFLVSWTPRRRISRSILGPLS